ncbi:DUF6456 domain-containing protein [Thioclava sp. 'Guangxiensis']|uniref:helix-turn-helix domain-containing protein n=1 Tax=Thioclava sp. 'Guangxiensis' TaxID=3149044 RepID=UPI003877EF10
MKIILRLRATRHLSEQQVLTAARFAKDPNRFRLAPTGFRLLHDVILKGTPLEQIEQRRGWSARSAKIVLSVLLHMIEETEGTFWSEELEGSAEEMLAYLKGEDDYELLEIQNGLGLQAMPARILQILIHAQGPVSGETLARRIETRCRTEVSDKAIKVHIVHIRAALPADLSIKTHIGFGYELQQAGRKPSAEAALGALQST